MNDMKEFYDDYTINVAQNRLLIKFEDGKWNHYVLRLEADEDPDKCEGDNDECGTEEYGLCWRCDREAPWLTMWAEAIDDPDESYCLNDEFCSWKGDIMEMIDKAKEEYGEENVLCHGVRHGDDGDWTLGRTLAACGFLVNRVGWVLSIPRPTPKLEITDCGSVEL
jgi:hypothetical protein